MTKVGMSSAILETLVLMWLARRLKKVSDIWVNSQYYLRSP